MSSRFSFFFRSPLVVGVAVILAALCLIWGLGHLLIDKKAVASRLFDGVHRITGYEVSAASVDLAVFPLPEITLTRFEVKNAAQASTDRFLLAEEVRVSLSVTDVLLGRLRPSTVTIRQPAVELEVFRDRTTNWDFVRNLSNADLNFINPSTLAIEGGSVNLTDTAQHRTLSLDGIAFSLDFDALLHDAKVNVSFRAFEKNITAQGAFTAKAFSGISRYSFGLRLDIWEGNNRVSYEGDVGHDRYGLNYDGKFSLHFENAVPWLEVMFSEDTKEGVFHNLAAAVPLEISGKAKAAGKKYALTELSVKTADTGGSGQVAGDANLYPQVQAAFTFSSLDLGKIFDRRHPVSEEAFNRFMGRFLPQDISAAVDVHADAFRIAGIAAQDAKLLLMLDDGEMIVNQASLRMAGDTKLVALGIVKRNQGNAVNFDGNVELIGDRLKDFAAALGFDRDRFITDYDGAFRAKASVFLSKANSVVSDFKLQAGTLLAGGGMTASADREDDAEITLRVSGMKLDPFAALLIPASAKDPKKSGFGDTVRRLDWLDDVRSTVLMNLVLQNYTLSDTVGKQSILHVRTQPKQLSITNSSFELGGVVWSGDFSYDQRTELPQIASEMAISQFDLEPYTANNLRKSPVPRDNYRSVWSEALFNFDYLRGFNSDVDIRVGEVHHPEFPMSDLYLSAKSADGKWDIRDFQADIWGGRLKAGGGFDITSIPTLSLSFSLENIASEKLVQVMAGRSNFRGGLSLNGQFATSGISAHNWVKNGRGTFALLGQNVAVKGFDVSALVQAVPSVRTVADLVNTARVSMLQRYTTFSVVEGGFYMEAGILKPTELKLRAKHSIGIVTGQMDFTTWIMECGIEFGLISLGEGDYPSLGIHFANSMDDPEVTLDTRSLESFIARKKLR